MKTATLFTHQAPEKTREALAAVMSAAKGAGWRVVATEEEKRKHGAEAAALEAVGELPTEVDLCLVLGGDGSILRALRHYAGTETPVFGVNFGTVGFLAAVERAEAPEGLARVFAGDYEILRPPALAFVRGDETQLGFNDITFTRRPHERVAELAYRIAGEEVGHVRCDGLVAATPTGSTGYNLANHGPILAWGVAGYVVSYISPHSLTARALVVAPEDALHVANAGSYGPVEIAVDGRPVGALDPGAEAAVTYRAAAGRLAQLPGSSFYHRIRIKFGHLAV